MASESSDSRLRVVRRFVNGLILTHRSEREDWQEPMWTAYLCQLNGMLNLIDALLSDSRISQVPTDSCGSNVGP